MLPVPMIAMVMMGFPGSGSTGSPCFDAVSMPRILSGAIRNDMAISSHYFPRYVRNPMDLLDGIRAFVATAQTGSFTAGAERLGLSNRLASKYVAELEERLGVRLLQRTTRKVGITAAGEALLARAPALIEDLDDLVSGLSERSDRLSGLIRITAPLILGALYIKGLVSRFAALHPDLSIDLQLNDRYVDLAAHGVDVAFRIGEPDLQSLRVRRLGAIRTAIVAAPSYLARTSPPERPEDLMRHACIVDTNRRDPLRWRFARDGRAVEVPIRGRLSVNNTQVASELASDGLGLALCPRFVVEDSIRAGRLVPLLEAYEPPGLPLNIVYLGGRTVPRKLRALIDFAVADVGRRPVL